MCFSAAASSVKAQGSMNFGLKHRACLLDDPVQRCRHPSMHGMSHALLDILDRLSVLSADTRRGSKPSVTVPS